MKQKKSILFFSRLKIHGAVLNKKLSLFYDISWVGKNFPIKINLLNFVFILFYEFFQTMMLLRKKRFSLVLVQYVSLDCIIPLFFASILQIKLVLFAVGSDVLKISDNPFSYPIVRGILKKSNLILCASNPIRLSLISMGFSQDKTKVIPSIIDLDDLELNTDSKKYDVVNIGSLDSNKNQTMLIKACELLPHIKLLLIGDGPLRKALESEVLKKKLDVIFTGNISHKNALKELQKAKLYVHTSSSEGLPVAVLEAMLCKLPIITLDRPYVRAMVNSYSFDIHIVKNDSVEDLANSITNLLDNYEVAIKKVSANYDRVFSLSLNNLSKLKLALDKIS